MCILSATTFERKAARTQRRQGFYISNFLLRLGDLASLRCDIGCYTHVLLKNIKHLLSKASHFILRKFPLHLSYSEITLAI
jgi:hypothetical protein